MFENLSSKILVPAQGFSYKYRELFNVGRSNLINTFKAEQIKIIAHDNIKLDSLLIRKPKSFFDFFKPKKILIRFGGNGENYEIHGLNRQYINVAHRLGCDVLLHNYRGVGQSESFPTESDLAKDGN